MIMCLEEDSRHVLVQSLDFSFFLLNGFQCILMIVSAHRLFTVYIVRCFAHCGYYLSKLMINHLCEFVNLCFFFNFCFFSILCQIERRWIDQAKGRSDISSQMHYCSIFIYDNVIHFKKSVLDQCGHTHSILFTISEAAISTF